jgi:hypothetical protein
MTTYETRLNAIGRWLQGLLTWTPGQTDIIKTIALVLMVIDHTGLLLAGNNGDASAGERLFSAVWSGLGNESGQVSRHSPVAAEPALVLGPDSAGIVYPGGIPRIWEYPLYFCRYRTSDALVQSAYP